MRKAKKGKNYFFQIGCVGILALFLLAAPLWAALDPGVAGKWQYKVKNKYGAWLAIWVIGPDGRYTVSYVGTSALPGETGQWTTEDGKYQLNADSGRQDSGTYELKGKNTMVVTNPKLTRTLKRITTASAAPAASAAPLDEGPAGTFAAYRQAADKIAYGVSPHFKLFRVDCFGAKAGSRIQYKTLNFFYCAVNVYSITRLDGPYVILTVASGPDGAAKVGWGGSAPAFVPPATPCPPQVISEQDAFAKLTSRSLNLPDKDMYLQLRRAGDEPGPVSEANDTGYANGFQNLNLEDQPAFDRGDLKGRWVWRIITAVDASNKNVPDKFKNIGTGVYNINYLYVDAVSGDAL